MTSYALMSYKFNLSIAKNQGIKQSRFHEQCASHRRKDERARKLIRMTEH